MRMSNLAEAQQAIQFNRRGLGDGDMRISMGSYMRNPVALEIAAVIMRVVYRNEALTGLVRQTLYECNTLPWPASQGDFFPRIQAWNLEQDGLRLTQPLEHTAAGEMFLPVTSFQKL